MSDLDQTLTAMDIWPLSLPVEARRDHGIGSVAGDCEVIVVRLRAEGRAQAFGGASPWVVVTRSPEASYAAIHRYFCPPVIERRVADRAAIMGDATHAVAHCTEAKAALETALLDPTGQIADLPVYALLGGRCRDTIALSCSIANPNFDQDIALLRRLAEDGVGITKLKTGFRDHAFDMMRLECIRSEFAHLRIRIDYNQWLHLDEAPQRVCDVAHFEPDFIKQPVPDPTHNYDMMARLRTMVDVPLLADESIFGPEDMVHAAAEVICDGFSVKIMNSGGFTRARAVAQNAAAYDLSAYGGDMLKAGLAHLAGTHMIAATPQITLGCAFYQATYFLKEDILETPFAVKNSEVIVPDRPGFGARPDIDRSNHYTQAEQIAA